MVKAPISNCSHSWSRGEEYTGGQDHVTAVFRPTAIVLSPSCPQHSGGSLGHPWADPPGLKPRLG